MMGGMWGTIVSLIPIEMPTMEDAVQDLGHGVRGIDCAMDFEERQDAR
jgi:hypothetical protein